MDLLSKNEQMNVQEELPGGAGQKGKKEEQLKTYINFAEIKEKRTTNWIFVIPGIIVIALACAAFAKFGVIDMYNSVDKTRAEVSDLQTLLEKDNELINSADELTEEFYHNTWSDMEDEEKTRIRRYDAANLIEEISGKDIIVNSYNIRGNLITVDVTTDALSQVSKLNEKLTSMDAVESVTVANAQKETTEGEVFDIPVVTDEGESIERVQGESQIVVRAQLKIYMKGLGVTEETEEAE